jgi:hypothetical protein
MSTSTQKPSHQQASKEKIEESGLREVKPTELHIYGLGIKLVPILLQFKGGSSQTGEKKTVRKQTAFARRCPVPCQNALKTRRKEQQAKPRIWFKDSQFRGGEQKCNGFSNLKKRQKITRRATNARTGNGASAAVSKKGSRTEGDSDIWKCGTQA